MNTILDCHHKEMIFQSLNNAAIESEELNLVAILKPKLTQDGNRYCFLLGDNLQEGVAGFGKSAYDAAIDFNRNFYKQKGI